MKRNNILRMIAWKLVIELILYAILVIVYFLFVLRFLDGWLYQLFHNNLPLYGFIGLGLILVQGAFLDTVTSFFLNRLPLDRWE
jgi:hypothetical protein